MGLGVQVASEAEFHPSGESWVGLKTGLKSFGRFLLGLVISLITFVGLPLPLFLIFLYRLLVIKLIAPFYRSEIGNPLSPIAIHYGAELSGRNLNDPSPSKGSLLTIITFDGHISLEEFMSLVERKCIHKRCENGNLFYPELQQYVESWMGFLFWKWDRQFDIKNHFHVYSIREGENSELFRCNLMEVLLNKSFPPNKSPWAVHLIHNYRNPDLNSTASKNMTVVVLHIHHCMGDGQALMRLVIEDLLGENLKIPYVSKSKPHSTSSFLTNGSKMFRLFTDIGYVIEMIFDWSQVYRISPAAKKRSKTVYGKSRLIPLSKIKDTKNRLGTGFSEVLLSCVSAGISKNMKMLQIGAGKSNISLGVMLPLSNRPEGLRNHFTFATVNLPTLENLQPLDRLLETRANVIQLKNSALHLALPVATKFLSYQISSLARQTCQQRLFAVGLSNFPGPAVPVSLEGKKVISVDFALGLLQGVAGLAITVISYNDQIRIAATADSSIMGKYELDSLLASICNEVDLLSEFGTRITNNN